MPAHIRATCLALLVISILSAAPKRPALGQDEPAPRKLALLVGVRTYDHADLPDLDFPENDVEELAAVLVADDFETAVLTTSRGKKDDRSKPTAENIRARLNALLRRVTKRDLVLVSLAGHGIQPLGSDESYFCPADANPVVKNDKPIEPDRLVSIGELLGRMSESGIGFKLLLVDACRNDPSTRNAKRRGVDHVNVAALPSQTGVLLSCSQGEFSFEDKSLELNGGLKGHGVFFYHVIDAFKGAAKDAKNQVTWDALGSYVRTEVPSTVLRLYGKNGGEQSPNAIGNLRGAPPVLARITDPSFSRSVAAPNTMTDRQNDTWVTKAQSLWEIGDYDGLDKLASERLRDHPESALALTYRAEVLRKGGHPDDALAAVNNALRLDKDLARAHDVRGNVYYSKSDYDLALRDYTEAVRLAPQTAEYYVDRGWCYISISSWTQAIADANQALLVDPQCGGAYLLRGSAKSGGAGSNSTGAEAGMADQREAIRLFRKQIEKNSENRSAMRTLATSLMNLGDYSASIDVANSIVRKGWATDNDFLTRGKAYSSLGQYEWALADLTRVIQRAPLNSEAYDARAYAYNETKNYDQAIRDATEAIRIDPKDAYAYFQRGLAYARKDDVANARADYERVLQIDPGYKLARSNLANLGN